MAILPFRSWLEQLLTVPAGLTNGDADCGFASSGARSKYSTDDDNAPREAPMKPSPEERFGIRGAKKKPRKA